MLPIIIDRLKAKVEEMKKSRDKWARKWKQGYEENYPKSLDYESEYWKDDQKRLLQNKNIIIEAKNRRKSRLGIYYLSKLKSTPLYSSLYSSLLLHLFLFFPFSLSFFSFCSSCLDEGVFLLFDSKYPQTSKGRLHLLHEGQRSSGGLEELVTRNHCFSLKLCREEKGRAVLSSIPTLIFFSLKLLRSF